LVLATHNRSFNGNRISWKKKEQVNITIVVNQNGPIEGPKWAPTAFKKQSPIPKCGNGSNPTDWLKKSKRREGTKSRVNQ